MRTTTGKLLTFALTPLSWLYWGVTEVRNQMFRLGVLPQKSYNVPVVCVGNLTVGGTGKTPMVEMLLRHLQTEYRIGVVSRGYKRKTKGFLLANSKSTPATIGDEPFQMYQKFGKRVKVAVCEKRTKGIERLLQLQPEINLIILDDAFQHRYVKPKVSILLMDKNRPVYDDKILPLGRLREHKSGIYRAGFIVVTKCPQSIKPVDCRLISDKLSLFPYQKLFFSYTRYLNLKPVFEDEAPYSVTLDSLTSADTIILVTGIANPRPLIRECRKSKARIKIIHFPDHHDFTTADLTKIENKFNRQKGARKIIVTTEKDAGRMLHNPFFPESLKPYCFYLPIEMQISPSWKNAADFIPLLKEAIDK